MKNLARLLARRISFLKSPHHYVKNLVDSNINLYSQQLEREFFSRIDDFTENDIHIVGYPKSGNTWMQSMIAGLQFGIDTKLLPDKLAQEIVPDVYTRTFYKRFGDITFFKSHDLPRADYRNVIYIVRDGRDVMVSYLHYNKKLGINTTLNDMVFAGADLFPCKWHHHVREWLRNPYGSNILYVRYEDLLNDPVSQVRRMLQFSKLERSQELIDRVIAGNSFEAMKGRAVKYGGLGNHNWTGSEGHNFFRQGKTGSYRDEFPSDLLSYFEQEASQELTHFSYEL